MNITYICNIILFYFVLYIKMFVIFVYLFCVIDRVVEMEGHSVAEKWRFSFKSISRSN